MKDRRRGDDEEGRNDGKGKATEAEVGVGFIHGFVGSAGWRSRMKAKVWEGRSRYIHVRERR